MSNLYFNHSYSLRNQTEILELRAEFGVSGYGTYLMLLETIAESETQSINKNLLSGLALSLFIDKNLLKNVIDFCIKLDLFFLKDEFIFSRHLDQHFKKRAEIREQRSKAGAKGGKSKANAKQMLSNDKQSKVKKESKTNKTKTKVKEILDYFNQTHNRKLKSTHAWEDNFNFWLQTYNTDEIKTAIDRLNHPNWWAKDKPDLELLFRKSNKAGKCDYINQLLELESIEEEDDHLYVVDRSKFATQEEFDREMHWVKTRFGNQFKIINQNND